VVFGADNFELQDGFGFVLAKRSGILHNRRTWRKNGLSAIGIARAG
jgi:hypothetical protein